MLIPTALRRRGRSGAGAGGAGAQDELLLLDRLRRGDEGAFVELVGRHHESMVRLARSYVPTLAVAEEVVQETWLIALRSIGDFEGRSSVKTWLFRILMNRARSTGTRERRQVPVADSERSVDPSRFDGQGAWASPPVHWVDEVDERLVAEKLSGSIRVALDDLPDLQREVLVLRDVEGVSGAEACEILGITESNQRVLLHRGRSRLRRALAFEFGEGQP